MTGSIKKEFENLRNPEKALILKRFFKTGKGEYGQGDVFLGIIVPKQRELAKKFGNLGLKDIQNLLNSKVHEHRLTSLFILIERFKKADEKGKKEIFEFYLRNTKNINNWDLVDLSAPNIVGNYLLDKNRGILYKLAKSNNLWEKRIAVLSTFAFIREKDFDDSLRVAEILLNEKHDLIHKAVGWMLREIGKRSQPAEERFLRKHYKTMPRTMLRYAIERFDDRKKAFYMKQD